MLRYDRQTKPGLVALYRVRHPARKRSGSILTTPELRGCSSRGTTVYCAAIAASDLLIFTVPKA